MESDSLSVEGLQICIDQLPDVVSGDRSRLAETLLDFLAGKLRLDLACLRLQDPAHDFIARTAGLAPGGIAELLTSPAGQPPLPMTRPDDGLSVLTLPLGAHGVLLAGSRRSAFPQARERLLLTAAANQAAIALEAATLHQALRDREAMLGALKAAEAAQAESKRYLAQLIDMIPALAWVANADGYPEFFNQYYLDYAGRSREQMMGDGWARNLYPDDLPALVADWAAIMASRRAGETKARMRRADGEFRWFLFRCNPLHDEDGNVIRWFGVNTDVEDRTRVEEMLRNTQAQLAHMTRVMTMGQLTASIAHELNQPLSGIITNAGTCLRMLAANPPNITGARETARRTIRDGNRASEVISRLRALFSRKTTVAEPIDLNTATQEVIALASTELQRTSVSLRTGLAENLPLVIGDRIQLQQVILNLIMNATEAMRAVENRARELVVSTELEGSDRVRLAVKDVGIGLDVEAVEKLFTPFYTTKSTGMGIGLSVSRSIVEHHQGRIWAEANDGPGATFLISLPVRQDAELGARP